MNVIHALYFISAALIWVVYLSGRRDETIAVLCPCAHAYMWEYLNNMGNMLYGQQIVVLQ